MIIPNGTRCKVEYKNRTYFGIIVYRFIVLNIPAYYVAIDDGRVLPIEPKHIKVID